MKNSLLLLIVLSLLSCAAVVAQTGLTVGPPRVYFTTGSGQTQVYTVDVTNPSKDYTLELAVSLEDWQYDAYGDNVTKPKGSLPTSCAAWINVSETYFSLKPGERKQLQLSMHVPKDKVYSDSIPVHTAMLFVTQLNPKEGNQKEGANIRIAVRSGIKLYHRFPGKEKTDLEITNLNFITVDDGAKLLETSYTVKSEIWLEGQVRTELINQETGKKYKLDNVSIYCMPGDKRILYTPLPQDLEKGRYLASVMIFYGEDDSVKAAEKEFDI